VKGDSSRDELIETVHVLYSRLISLCVIAECSQQLEMETAVNNVGSTFTDDHINELTLRHFENLQVHTSYCYCQLSY